MVQNTQPLDEGPATSYRTMQIFAARCCDIRESEQFNATRLVFQVYSMVGKDVCVCVCVREWVSFDVYVWKYECWMLRVTLRERERM